MISLPENFDIATCIAKLNEPDPTGMMPIHWAAYNGYLACVKELVEAGANVDTLNSGLNTPLMIAASRGYYEVVSYLVDNDADISIRNLKDRDALFMAVLYAYKCRSLKNIIDCLRKRSGTTRDLYFACCLCSFLYLFWCR
jgi:ankyrin repeat protein